MKKLLIIITISILITQIAFSKVYKVITPSGPSVITLAKMIRDVKEIDGNEIKYEVLGNNNLLVSRIIKEEADFIIVPTNLASKLYNKGAQYKILNSSIWGNLHIISRSNIRSIKELKGKRVNLIGRGMGPDVILRFVLKQNGINPDKDLKLNYLQSPSLLAKMAIIDKNDITLIPEPLATIVLNKNSKFKRDLNINNELKKIGIDSFPQTVMLIKNSINDREFVNKFNNHYKKSINWANEKNRGLINIINSLNIGLNGDIALKAIDYINLRFVDAKDSRKDIDKYLNLLKGFDKKFIGGALPKGDFYYEE